MLNTIPDNDLEFLEIHPTNNNILYLASLNKIQKSTDGGATWATIYTFSTKLNQVYITILKNTAVSGGQNNVYILSYLNATGEILKSSNSGGSFSSITTFNGEVGQGRVFSLYTSKNWLQVSQFSSESYETYYVGGTILTMFSANSSGIYSYTPITSYFSTEVHPDVRYLKILKNNSSDTLLIGTDGGVSRIINARSNGRLIQNLQGKNLALGTLLQVAINPNADQIATCMQDNGRQCLNSPLTNDSYIWTDGVSGDHGSVVYDKNGLLYSGAIGRVQPYTTPFNIKSINQNSNSFHWPKQDLTVSGSYLYTQEDLVTSQELTAANINTGATYRLTNRVLQRDGDFITDIEVGKNNPNIIYYSVIEPRYGSVGIGTYSSLSYNLRLFRSDKGINSIQSDWVEISTHYNSSDYHANNTNDIKDLDVATITDVEVNELNDNDIFVSLGGFVTERIYHTTNANAINSNGHSMVEWTPITTNCLPPGPINCIEHLPGPKFTLFVGTDAGVYYFVEGENCWHDMNNGLPQGIVTDIKLDSLNNKLFIATYGRGVWSSGLPCSGCNPVTNFYTLSTDETWTQNVFFNKSIIIPSGKKLTIKNCSVHMPARSEIIVQKGGELIVDHARLTSTCWQSWAGINIEGDGPVNPQSNSTSGTVRIKNGSIIERASNACEIFEGGRLFASNSTFKNNFMSLTYYPYYGSAPYQHQLLNVKFINDDTVENGGATAIHIVLMDNYLNLDNCTFENSINQLKLLNQDRGTGILIFNGAVRLWPGLNSNPYQSTENNCSYISVASRGYFKNLDIGIEWYNSTANNGPRNNTVTVDDYDFINCGRGLKANSSKNDYFYHNNFMYLDDMPTYLNPKYNNSSNSESYIAGIVFNRSQGAQLYNNKFERVCSTFNCQDYLDTIYDIMFMETDNGVNIKANILTTILQNNQFSNIARTNSNNLKYINIATYLYGNNQKLSLRCNNFENKLLDYLFYGNVSTRNYLNETVEFDNNCDGQNTHNSYPNIQLIGERVITTGTPNTFINWNLAVHSVVNPCISLLAPNGTKYIKSTTPAINNCGNCTPVTFNDIYCSGGGVIINGFVVQEKNNDCGTSLEKDKILKTLINSGLKYSQLNEDEKKHLDSLEELNCLSFTEINIIQKSKQNILNTTDLNSLIEHKNIVNLFPNPAENLITLDYDFESQSNYQVIIYDNNGKLILNKRLPLNKGKIEINSSNWADGLYFANIVKDNTTINVIKFNVIH